MTNKQCLKCDNLAGDFQTPALLNTGKQVKTWLGFKPVQEGTMVPVQLCRLHYDRYEEKVESEKNGSGVAMAYTFLGGVIYVILVIFNVVNSTNFLGSFLLLGGLTLLINMLPRIIIANTD